jgi:hypothetical protein
MKSKQGQIFFAVHPSAGNLHVGKESYGFPTRWLVAAAILVGAALLFR